MKDFKDFVLNHSLEELGVYCLAKTAEHGFAPVELGMKAIDAVGTFYCPDENLARRFGFLAEEQLNSDCAEIAQAAGVSTGVVIDALHKEFSESAFGGGFYGGQIIFVDLTGLKKHFKVDDVALNG